MAARRTRTVETGEVARLGDIPSPENFSLDSTSLISYLWMLSDMPDGEAVAFAICRGLFAPYNADLVMLYVARPDGKTLDLAASYGLGRQQSAVYGIVTSDMHLPGAESFRTGTEKVVTAQDVADSYPLASPFFRSRPPQGDIAFLPLRHRGAPIGFVVLGFTQHLPRTWQLRATIDGLLSATVMWVLADTALRGVARSNLQEAPPLSITARQREILVLLRSGLTNRDIAESLGSSPATIKADITSLGAMLGASGRAELLARAERAGM